MTANVGTNGWTIEHGLQLEVENFLQSTWHVEDFMQVAKYLFKIVLVFI